MCEGLTVKIQALPLSLTPERLQLQIDGGYLNNMPVDVMRELGVDTVRPRPALLSCVSARPCLKPLARVPKFRSHLRSLEEAAAPLQSAVGQQQRVVLAGMTASSTRRLLADANM